MEKRKIHWSLIARWSAIAFLMAALSIFGYTRGIELYLWSGFALLCAAGIVYAKVPMAFTHAFLVGLIWGSLNGFTQALFYGTYIEHNPEFAEAIKEVPDYSPQLMLVISGPVIGALTGVVLGLLAYIGSALRR